jgi:hypothetical protein
MERFRNSNETKPLGRFHHQEEASLLMEDTRIIGRMRYGQLCLAGVP